MRTYKHASEVLERNKTTLVFFTHGDYFSYDDTGNGETGKWRVDPAMVEGVDKVIVYLRRNGETVASIFLGNYARIQ